jgi:hypothetical protein
MQQQIDFGSEGGGTDCHRKDCPRKKARMGMENLTEIDLDPSGAKKPCGAVDCPWANLMP